jgi:hypothetical protein
VPLLGLALILGVAFMNAALWPVQKPAGGVTTPSVTPYPGGWVPRSQIVVVHTVPRVYVQESMSSAWDVKGAARFVDKYTVSKVVMVKKCPASGRCVVVRPGAVKGGPTGVIGYTKCVKGWCVITIDTRDAGKSGKFGPKTRKWLLVHEFGHTYGLAHRKTCTTAMYQYRRCTNGHVPPVKFDRFQRVALGKR